MQQVHTAVCTRIKMKGLTHPLWLFVALYGVYVQPSGQSNELSALSPIDAFLHTAAGGGGGPTAQLPPTALQSTLDLDSYSCNQTHSVFVPFLR